jgi:ribosomal-protein-alanine N-acetyltransferase
MPNSLRLQLATARDVPIIAAMSRELIETGLGWSWTRARVARALASADTNVLVTRTPRRVVGFAIMRYRDQTAHLDLLAVAPDHRRRGEGRRLVEWLETVAEVAGIAKVYVEARARREGTLTFYRRLGYVEAERLAGYYQGREDAVRLAKTLRPAMPPTREAWSLPSFGAGAAQRRD